MCILLRRCDLDLDSMQWRLFGRSGGCLICRPSVSDLGNKPVQVNRSVFRFLPLHNAFAFTCKTNMSGLSDRHTDLL